MRRYVSASCAASCPFVDFAGDEAGLDGLARCHRGRMPDGARARVAGGGADLCRERLGLLHSHYWPPYIIDARHGAVLSAVSILRRQDAAWHDVSPALTSNMSFFTGNSQRSQAPALRSSFVTPVDGVSAARLFTYSESFFTCLFISLRHATILSLYCLLSRLRSY